jgi:hypothetical protein
MQTRVKGGEARERRCRVIDNRSGSGYQVLRRWRFQGSDGAVHEVVLTASTLLPARPGPIPKRYLVTYGSPIAVKVGHRGGEGMVGEYDDYAAALGAAESFVREKQDQQG